MNNKVHPALIGAFVIGAMALVVIAVVLLGSGRLFHQTREFVLYFDSSVNGLRLGAPVKFRGVEIGSVRNIMLQLEPESNIKRIPVVIEIDADKITRRGGPGATLNNPEAARGLIDQGLRAQLQMESFVTGLLYIGLDLMPESPANFVQPPGSKYIEIPTLPTALEKAQDAANQILAQLEEVDLRKLVSSVTQAIEGINRLVSSPEFRSAARSVERTMPKIDEAIVNLRDLAATMNASVETLSDDLQRTSAEARTALKQASATMQQVETTVADVQSFVAADSPAFYELGKSLREVSGAARSLRLLANDLRRNPRALLFGKPEARGE
jgi:paraquat-inducible protein B